MCREDAVSEAVGSFVPILLTLVKHLFLAPSLCSILMLFIKIHFCFFGHILLCNPNSTMLHFCFLLFLNDSLAFTQHVANTVYNFLSILMPTLHPHSVWTKKRISSSSPPHQMHTKGKIRIVNNSFPVYFPVDTKQTLQIDTEHTPTQRAVGQYWESDQLQGYIHHNNE